jgi:phosphopantetheinyl transferase
MRKDGKPFKFWGIFQVDTSGLGMCKEKSVAIGIRIIRPNSEVLESAEPLGHPFGVENEHR